MGFLYNWSTSGHYTKTQCFFNVFGFSSKKKCKIRELSVAMNYGGLLSIIVSKL